MILKWLSKALLVDRHHKTNTLQIISRKQVFRLHSKLFAFWGFSTLEQGLFALLLVIVTVLMCPAVFYLNGNRVEPPAGDAEQEHTGVSQSEAQKAEGSRDTDSAAASGYSVSAGNFKTKFI